MRSSWNNADFESCGVMWWMDMFEGGEIALYGLESDFGDKLEFHFILFLLQH